MTVIESKISNFIFFRAAVCLLQVVWGLRRQCGPSGAGENHQLPRTQSVCTDGHSTQEDTGLLH